MGIELSQNMTVMSFTVPIWTWSLEKLGIYAKVAVRALLEGRDVLAVLPTTYSKSLTFVHAKDY